MLNWDTSINTNKTMIKVCNRTKAGKIKDISFVYQVMWTRFVIWEAKLPVPVEPSEILSVGLFRQVKLKKRDLLTSGIGSGRSEIIFKSLL